MQLGRNILKNLLVEDNHNYMRNMCAKEFSDSNFT